MTDQQTHRMDVVEALEADGWTADDDWVLRKGSAVWAVTNDCDDSRVSGSGGWTVEFPADAPGREDAGRGVLTP